LRLAKQSQFIPLQNVVYFITLPVLVRKLFTFYKMMYYYLNVQFRGQRVNHSCTVSAINVQHLLLCGLTNCLLIY